MRRAAIDLAAATNTSLEFTLKLPPRELAEIYDEVAQRLQDAARR